MTLRLALLNPNTNAATTAMMAAIAAANVPPGIRVEGHTMALGPPVITEEKALAEAGGQVVAVGRSLAADGAAGLLVAAFGDPGLGRLRARACIPVTGLAEAGMAEAARHGRFSIITTTPALRGSILGKVRAYGHEGQLVSLRISAGDVAETMSSPARMAEALAALARDCAREGAQAVLVGGGPLASAVPAVAASCPLPVIEPVAAGTRRLAALMAGATSGDRGRVL
ncbi:aspartate/glutamate racemase family protein [Mangrovicoccus sp. HB161399]|uniref:aspartate/glutamate racemase family protein n=1 Tax=Mangrovicoccus sp. HB161399 TaxID=2720392 RepID=UPI001552DA7E|nr:aspartate/glutamate racemase family protein [Mangrovicoccus sp. HB161399]